MYIISVACIFSHTRYEEKNANEAVKDKPHLARSLALTFKKIHENITKKPANSQNQVTGKENPDKPVQEALFKESVKKLLATHPATPVRVAYLEQWADEAETTTKKRSSLKHWIF